MGWGDGSKVPTSDKKSIIIGVDDQDLLHIRILDANGDRVVDTDETTLLRTQAEAILRLKEKLPQLLPPHVLTDDEKKSVTAEAVSNLRQYRVIIACIHGLDERSPRGSIRSSIPKSSGRLRRRGGG